MIQKLKDFWNYLRNFASPAFFWGWMTMILLLLIFISLRIWHPDPGFLALMANLMLLCGIWIALWAILKYWSRNIITIAVAVFVVMVIAVNFLPKINFPQIIFPQIHVSAPEAPMVVVDKTKTKEKKAEATDDVEEEDVTTTETKKSKKTISAPVGWELVKDESTLSKRGQEKLFTDKVYLKAGLKGSPRLPVCEGWWVHPDSDVVYDLLVRWEDGTREVVELKLVDSKYSAKVKGVWTQVSKAKAENLLVKAVEFGIKPVSETALVDAWVCYDAP